MLELVLALAPGFALAQGNSAQGQETVEIPLEKQRLIDACNYLAIRLRLLKTGAALEELKTEIVSQIDFTGLPREFQGLFQETIRICDDATRRQHAVLEASAVLGRERDEAAGMLTGIGTSLVTGNPLSAALAAFSALGSEPSAAEEDLAARQQQAVIELGAEISELELKLSILRGRAESIPKEAFVTAEDYDLFLQSARQSAAEDRIAGVQRALLRSPELQPAALYLALYYAQTGDYEQAVSYAARTIETSPVILRRDGLKARAYLAKAYVALMTEDPDDAAEMAELGLDEDESDPALKFVLAYSHMVRGQHEKALPLLREAIVLAPRNPTYRYNLACCHALGGDLDKALSSFEMAIDHGFEQIGHAREDPDLELLRTEGAERFEDLVALKIRPKMNWNALVGDDLHLVNDGRFALVDVAVELEFLIRSGSSNQVVKPAREIRIERLSPGEEFVIKGAVKTTQTAFRGMRLYLSGSQGSYEGEFHGSDLVPNEDG